MAVYVRCPHCNKNQMVGRSDLDKTVLCPKCRKAYVVGVDTIYDSDDAPDPGERAASKEPSVEKIVYIQNQQAKKSSGCVTALVWIVAIYFYINAAVCVGLAKDDPAGIYMGGAVISGVIAVLFTVLASYMSK